MQPGRLGIPHTVHPAATRWPKRTAKRRRRFSRDILRARRLLRDPIVLVEVTTRERPYRPPPPGIQQGPAPRRAADLTNERSSERKVTRLGGRNQAVGFDRSDSGAV